MAASESFVVNEVSEVTAFEVSRFVRFKVTEMLSCPDATIKIYFH